MSNIKIKEQNISIVIGRFQPFHTAHLKLLKIALAKYDKTIVIIGSAHTARSIRNPFTFEERKHMILNALSEEERCKIKIKPMRDYLYSNNLWVSRIQKVVDDECDTETIDGIKTTIHLIGHNRDSSSFYLNLFPQWKFHDVGKLENDISASLIRKELFTTNNIEQLKSLLPSSTIEFLYEFIKTEEFENLKEENDAIIKSKSAWENSPYPPVFITTDALVIKSGHILLVQRKFHPGKDLYALPGGYLKHNESIIDSMIRELKEETKIKRPKDLLLKTIVSSAVFDEPNRDSRGRIVTHAYCIDLGSGALPEIAGADDAKAAFWLPISEAMACSDMFFADHWHIIMSMLGKLM